MYIHGRITCKVAIYLALGVLGPLSWSKAPDPSEVQVWLTVPDGQNPSVAFQKQKSLRFSIDTSAANVPVIDIDPSAEQQPLAGIGAAMTESSTVNILKLPPDQQRRVMDLLFDANRGAGFSFIRMPMGASDFSDSSKGSFSYDDIPKGYADPQLKYFSIERDKKSLDLIKQARAINPNIKVMASPWSPPPWMKNNHSYNGGKLLPQYRAAYAAYLVRALQEYEGYGIHVDYFSLQNEPGYATGGYPSMGVTANESQVFIRDFLGPAMANSGVRTKLLILDHNWDMYPQVNQILDDPYAKQYVGGVAYHAYGGTVDLMLNSMNRHPEVPTFQTEYSSVTDQQGAKNYFFQNFFPWWVQNEIIAPFRMGVRSAAGWNLVLDENNGPRDGGWKFVRPMITVNQKTYETSFAPEYYAAEHASKFITSTSKVIASTDTASLGVSNVVFSSRGSDYAMVVQNSTTAVKAFRLRNADGRTVDYMLPPNAVATMLWNIPKAPYNSDSDAISWNANQPAAE